MRGCVISFGAAALLVGCSDNTSDPLLNAGSTASLSADSHNSEQGATDYNQVLNSLGPAPAQQTPVVSHNYNFKEGDLYGYLGGISEEDQKKGIAAPPVVRFRYTGFWGGAHHLQLVDDNGAVIDTEECQVPCVAIKETGANGVRRIGYSTDSIVGAAFEDAMNGRLRGSPAPGSVREGYRFKGGDPSNPANWRAISPPISPIPAPTHSERPQDDQLNLNAY